MLNSTPQRKFSRNHGFSQAEVAQAATVVAQERPSKRLLINVTMGHRRLAMRQLLVSTLVGTLTMLSLYIAERVSPTLDQASLETWIIVTVAYIFLRGALSVWIFSHSPADMARSVVKRLLPLGLVLLTAAQWMWCINLFINDTFSVHVFILFAGLLGVSIAVMGMWPTIPIATVCYLATAWPPFFIRLYQVDWTTGPILLILVICVGLVLWSCVFLEVKQIKSILDGSDETDLLVDRLNTAIADQATANTLLNAMRKSATAELESRSIFFSSASHDFRQRLHAMKLLCRSALDESECQKLVNVPLNRLADAVEDVEHYITELLDFARIDGQNLNPNKGHVKLQPLFQQLDLTFEDVATAKGVNLSVRATEISLNTDPAMMQRILENLISNAIKFSSGGRVLVAARPRQGGVAIEIWDQGPGILPEAHAKIFTPFHQSSVGDTTLGGVGLGLAVVKRFIDCMQYEISVRSRVGSGTVMTVLIPAIDVLQSAKMEV